MINQKISLLPELRTFIQTLDFTGIANQRKSNLQKLIDFGREQLANGNDVHLNFICTHNSRRSQFAQVWAQTAAACFDLPAHCYSGGVEVTEFNPRAVQSLERTGFKITSAGNNNPVYHLFFSHDADPVHAFSKIYDHTVNPKKHFAAIMTCSHADENCPFIPGAEKRIALNYDDPKVFDGTPQEAEKYDERSRQIATEMFYVFESLSSK